MSPCVLGVISERSAGRATYLGFSPFELLYGQTVRGPMAILRELWTKEVPEDEVQTTYQYVFELRNKLEETCKLVEVQLRQSSGQIEEAFRQEGTYEGAESR